MTFEFWGGHGAGVLDHCWCWFAGLVAQVASVQALASGIEKALEPLHEGLRVASWAEHASACRF